MSPQIATASVEPGHGGTGVMSQMDPYFQTIVGTAQLKSGAGPEGSRVDGLSRCSPGHPAVGEG